ncbi:MAG: PatB family C-S lyase, partial [Gammaproteobacteria bacterium]|nr:PatB family C-S lyase [Gammaproteobacteria bacterium]
MNRSIEPDFDAIIPREETCSSKWIKYKGRDIIPLWVADMDFRAPEPVIAALHRRVEHGIFGYTKPSPELLDVIVERMSRLYDWQIEAGDITFLPGVVSGLNLACRAFCTEDQSVFTAVPIYPPFRSAPGFSQRNIRTCDAEMIDGRWSFPVNGMKKALESGNIGLHEFCSPYNPLGRRFDREELETIAGLCVQHGTVICSDEIHCDLLFDGKSHIPTATLNREVKELTVTLMAPSKTFNIAGLGASFAIIQNRELSQRFRRQMKGIMPDVNLLGYEAMLAAYRDSDDWYQALIRYLQSNRDLLYREINAMPGISVNYVEATHLAWLDVRALELDDPMTFFED